MNCEDVLNFVDELVFGKTGEHLSPPHQVIIRGTCLEQTFDKMAGDSSYSSRYLKEEGSKLWKLLSEVLGQEVCKKTFNWLIKQRFQEEARENKPSSSSAIPSPLLLVQSTIPSDLIGQTICNRYKIIKLLDRGKYGETYLAEDERLPNNRRCVIKRLRSESGETTGKFYREAAVLSQLGEHSQIPTLFDSFEKEGYFYLVQLYIEGNALSQELIEGQPWSEPQVIVLLLEILEILKFVHRREVIHRNINPQNLIRRDTDSKLVLTNFGSVKRINTRQGRTFAGSSAYIPPEQAMGYPELCSDIYALGIVGIQALTGLHPDKLEVDQLNILWQDKAQVSPDLAKVLDKMVCSDHHQRYPSAEEALQAVRALGGFR